MTSLMKMLAGGAGLAALATAAPATAQYYPQYGYNYGYGYGAMSTQTAASQCTAAVQNRLYTRTGLSGLVGSLFGLSGTSARVLSVTEARPLRTHIRVRGIATSGRQQYSPYGYGYYGALGAGYAPDLQFRCNVDYNGYVRSVDIRRR
jgi:hypothetical protein